MHARAASGQVQPGKMQEFIDIDNNEVVPICQGPEEI